MKIAVIASLPRVVIYDCRAFIRSTTAKTNWTSGQPDKHFTVEIEVRLKGYNLDKFLLKHFDWLLQAV